MKKLLVLFLLISGFGAMAQTTWSGSWIKKSYTVNGRWEIIKKESGHLLRLDEDFSAKKAPDLKIFLSPLSADEINSKNALKGSVPVSELKEYKGKLEFDIPNSISIGTFKTLLIHCEEYGVLWSAARLK